MGQEFAGKVAVVTGGSKGIGLGCAKAFLAEGARRVYITGRSAEALTAAAAELGERAIALPCDAARVADLDSLADRIAVAGDRIDVVVANAGISRRNELGATSEAEFDALFDTNVKGVFFTVQALAKLMVDGGAIVLISSLSAGEGRPLLSLYSATKAAVRSFARCFASDLKHRSIRVNAVSPGVVRTEIVRSRPGVSAEEAAKFEEQLEEYLRGAAPIPRSGTVAEIADAVLFLASPRASYITGADLGVDGGIGQI